MKINTGEALYDSIPYRRKHGLFYISRRCLHYIFSHRQCRKQWRERSRNESYTSPLRSQSRQAAGMPTDRIVWGDGGNMIIIIR